MNTSRLHSGWIDAELDYSAEDYLALVCLTRRLKAGEVAGADELLRGKTVHALLLNDSIRTQTSIRVGTQELGGNINILPRTSIYAPALPGDDRAYETERISDVARVLGSMGHAIAVRIYGDASQWQYGKGNRTLKEFSKHSGVPVINLECDRFHPTQALADLVTMVEQLGDVRKKRLVVSWAYSKSYKKPIAVPQSLSLLASKMGMNVVLAHPAGFELEPDVMDACRVFADESGGSFEVADSLSDAVTDADFVYAKSWGVRELMAQQGHQATPDFGGMQAMFSRHADGWTCGEAHLARGRPTAKYMHCLPCDRGQEVTEQVVDGSSSLVFSQAANRLHAMKAILVELLAGVRARA